MISKISFTGRETMLTQGIKEVANKKPEYVGVGKIFSQKGMTDSFTRSSVANDSSDFVADGKIFLQDEVKKTEKAVKEALSKDREKRLADDMKAEANVEYTSPFAPTEDVQNSHKKAQDTLNGFLYNVAHGKPNKVAKESLN